MMDFTGFLLICDPFLPAYNDKWRKWDWMKVLKDESRDFNLLRFSGQSGLFLCFSTQFLTLKYCVCKCVCTPSCLYASRKNGKLVSA